MAMWTSVSVYVEAESVEDINRVVNEIDLSDYYLPKWDVYGTDADSSSLDDIKEGACDWAGLLALIAEKMGGRGKAWITEKCDEDYAYTTRYEYENGEITTTTEEEEDPGMEGDDEENEEEGEFGYCDFCGDETFNGTKLDSGSFVCERCLENCCEKCEECGKTFLSEAMGTYNGKRLCFICAGNLKRN